MTWYILAAVLIVCVLILVFRSRRKKKRNRHEASKHPSGLLVYGEKTQISIRPKLDLEDDASEGESVKAQEKSSSRKSGDEKTGEPGKVAVLKFKGDIRASARFAFAKLVDEVVLNAREFKEVVVVVESPGGGVSEYGMLFAELERMRKCEENFQLTVVVDTVAASGGYLMSLPAHKILAAPFAMVGSIGVVSFIPNIRELLEANKIKPRTFTAGDFKRTVTLTDEGDEKSAEQYKQQLALIHEQFKQALKKYRPQVELEKVATGEAWLASTTVEKELQLVDGLNTSHALLLEMNQSFDLVEYSSKAERKTFLKRILGCDDENQSIVDQIVTKFVDEVSQRFRI